MTDADDDRYSENHTPYSHIVDIKNIFKDYLLSSQERFTALSLSLCIFDFRILLFSFTPKDIPNRRARHQESGERTATEKKTTSKKEKKEENEGTACQVLTWAQD